ncbi:hypothetical protein VTL71DRAFT_12079 [Oculimacula yallundae]|uniref:SCP domain-containing protein n=1 Tax=Oculimacula yallundae TaxID=86028 RepID=A0ABR4CUA9_9HELO
MSPSLLTTTFLLALPILSSAQQTTLTTTLSSSPTTTTISPSSPSSSPSSSPNTTDGSNSFSDKDVFEKDMLVAHNFYRNAHGVPDLVWNETSAEFAADWARGCEFKHSGGPTGENLAAGYTNATASVDAWGLERTMYNFKKPGFNEKTGHFTQLVWGNTTSVGCAVRQCDGENKTPGAYVVCEYYPPGNVVGNKNQFFKENVPKQEEGKNTDTMESGVSATSGAMRHGVSSSGTWVVVLVIAVVGAWGL